MMAVMATASPSSNVASSSASVSHVLASSTSKTPSKPAGHGSTCKTRPYTVQPTSVAVSVLNIVVSLLNIRIVVKGRVVWFGSVVRHVV